VEGEPDVARLASRTAEANLARRQPERMGARSAWSFTSRGSAVAATGNKPATNNPDSAMAIGPRMLASFCIVTEAH
jgi:hypothetical protein